MNRRDLSRGGRYDTAGLIEDQYEPGSHRRVLKNLLGLRRKRTVDAAEAAALAAATDRVVDLYDQEHRFTAEDIRAIHRLWLGNLYEWAGRWRQVVISKGDFTFAMPAQIERLMCDLEEGPLASCTPCMFPGQEEVVRAIAVVHVELMLVHPFREGNGRAGRLLATLMALQAGLPILDFSGIRGRVRKAYFAAVRAGLDRNYEPMEVVFKEVIERTRRAAREMSSPF